MPNSSNYVQLIPSNPQSVSISRIAESATDTEILQGRTTAQFGFNSSDNIEMHFYDTTNRLVGSVLVPVSTNIISAKTVFVGLDEKEEKIIIDMSRVQKELGLIVPPGMYIVTLNLFSDEIGSYDNKKLVIEEISPSRTEIRLGYTKQATSVEQAELFEFTQPSLSRIFAAGLVGSTVGVGQDDIISETVIGANIGQTQQFVTDVNLLLDAQLPNLINDLYNISPTLQDNLNSTIEFTSAAIYDEFVRLLGITTNLQQFERLQDVELQIILKKAIDNVFTNGNINLFTNSDIQYI